ncbi:MAG TPA: type I-U CRISPR-associated protein Csx17, partial [Gemmataceae bacterium]
DLRGCTLEPLGNYLKGLGVFRLFAEQADPQARAWWKDGVLWLHSRWDKAEIQAFFLKGIGDKNQFIYSPTPIFSPWGGRPGFFADGNEKAKARLQKLRALKEPSSRFRAAHLVVTRTDEILTSRTAAVREKKKEVTKPWVSLTKDQRAGIKPAILTAMRNAWGETGLDWFDACVALEEDARFGFLYGTGGNEGSADITNNFWELIEDTIGLPTPKQDSQEALASAIFGGPRLGGTPKTAGQHFPLAAGSSNCGQEFFGSSSANPWDVILMMEGAVLFAGAMTKRLSQLGKGKAAFPFMLDHLATEEPAGSIKDEAKQDGNIIRCRAEFWMPLWGQPSTLPDVRALLAEGRLQRPSGARTEHTLHAMEAIRALGVSRGIDTFHRVALFERRGKGYYLASSLGFYPTAPSPVSLADKLGELEGFRQQVYRNLREGPGIADRLLRARQRLHATLAALLREYEGGQRSVSEELVEVLHSVATVEREVAVLTGRAQLLAPCPALGATWLPRGIDSPAFRLARAVATITAWGTSSTDGPQLPSVEAIRANLLPVVRRGKDWAWDDTTRSAVWSRGASLPVNLAGVLRRRLVDAQRGDGAGLPLWSEYGATFTDLLAFWQGTVDEECMADLVHALALIDAGRWTASSAEDWQVRNEPTPDLQSSAVWFDGNDQPRMDLRSPRWRGRPLLTADELRAAAALPRVYSLLKLCFLGGRLPRRPVEGQTVGRDGSEPHPPTCLDILSLLEAGRLPEAARTAARRLRAKGYPVVLRDPDTMALEMDVNDCRRLAGLLLIPVLQPGVLAALAVKPETTAL